MIVHEAQQTLIGLPELEQRIGDEPGFSVPDAHDRASDVREAIPVAVNLAERALALAAIVNYHNKYRQVVGSAVAVNNPNSAFCRRYGEDAPAVQRGAEGNRDELRESFDRGIETLAAVDALRANGTSEEDVEFERMRVQIGVNQDLRSGKLSRKV